MTGLRRVSPKARKKPSSVRDRAESEFRRVVRNRDRVCVGCGSDRWLEVAHVMSRRFDRTRCDPANARLLCAECHAGQTVHRWTWSDLIGLEEYGRLYRLATNPAWKRPHDWWEQCLAELREQP